MNASVEANPAARLALAGGPPGDRQVPGAGPTRWGASLSVTVEHLCKAFGTTPALHDVSLKIEPGELIALLGPSGSGKTTLLRILGGLEQPSEGRVMFDDKDALSLSVQQRNVGFVFQSYALFRHMTVERNVAFGLRVRPSSRRPSRSEIAERVNRLLDLVQLPGLAWRFPSQLSGGQRQRVALARALAIEPRLLLLDEPFGALDAKVRRELRRWLRELHDRTGHTTVFVTHDQEEAIELADRIVILNDGRIEQIGTPDEIYDRPTTPFVYGFIGESSQLPAFIDNGQIFVDDRPLGIATIGHSDGPAVLAFRPHQTEVVSGGGPAISGIVVATRRHGGTRRVEMEVGLARRRVEIDVPVGAHLPETGRIAFRPTAWKIFAAPAA